MAYPFSKGPAGIRFVALDVIGETGDRGPGLCILNNPFCSL